jgi:hypothetical protein
MTFTSALHFFASHELDQADARVMHKGSCMGESPNICIYLIVSFSLHGSSSFYCINIFIAHDGRSCFCCTKRPNRSSCLWTSPLDDGSFSEPPDSWKTKRNVAYAALEPCIKRRDRAAIMYFFFFLFSSANIVISGFFLLHILRTEKTWPEESLFVGQSISTIISQTSSAAIPHATT